MILIYLYQKINHRHTIKQLGYTDSLVIFQNEFSPDFIITSNLVDSEYKKDSISMFEKNEFDEKVNLEFLKIYYDQNKKVSKIVIIDYNVAVFIDYHPKFKHYTFSEHSSPKTTSIELGESKTDYKMIKYSPKNK